MSNDGIASHAPLHLTAFIIENRAPYFFALPSTSLLVPVVFKMRNGESEQAKFKHFVLPVLGLFP